MQKALANVIGLSLGIILASEAGKIVKSFAQKTVSFFSGLRKSEKDSK